MLKELRPALVLLIAVTVLTGVIYPLIVTGIAQTLMPARANGSLILQDGHLPRHRRSAPRQDLGGEPACGRRAFFVYLAARHASRAARDASRMSEPVPIAVLVEDERQIRRFVRDALQSEGWLVFEADTMKQGLVEAGTRKPDLVILDLGLPDADGMDFIRQFRGWSQVPVIVLSARTAENDKIEALDKGADDYLTKPFGAGELLARVRAAQRRSILAAGGGKPSARFGDVEVDLAARSVRKRGEPVHLTPIEYKLLALLIAAAGKVLTHRQICRDVWGPSHEQSAHYARIYMGHLRQKLEDDPAQPRYIVTETGVGYRLNL